MIISEQDLIKAGYDKSRIRKLVKQGKLILDYGRLKNGQIVRVYRRQGDFNNTFLQLKDK